MLVILSIDYGALLGRLTEQYDFGENLMIESVEHIRGHPAMYLGGTDSKGLHQTFLEVSDNAVNEVLAGRCDRIDVHLHSDGSLSVRDNGRGIDGATVAHSGLPYIEDIFVRFPSERTKLDDVECYRVSGGLHSVGLLPVAAVSEWMEVETWNNGNRLEIKFSIGRKSTPLIIAASSENTGTCVRWKPDVEIFSVIQFRAETIVERLQELAGINPGLHTAFHDESGVHPDCSFHYPDGMRDYLKALLPQEITFHAPIRFHEQIGNIIVDGALQFHDGGNHTLKCYANTGPITFGVPIRSFKEAVSRAVSMLVRRACMTLRQPVGQSTWSQSKPSVFCILSIRLCKPNYASGGRTCLDNPETHRPVFRAVYTAIKNALQEDPAFARALLKRLADSSDEAAQGDEDDDAGVPLTSEEERSKYRYGVDEWQVIDQVERIRRYPAMYVGGTDLRGLDQLFIEISDNAMNEVMSGYCRRIDVCLHKDGSLSVRDDGSGISAAVAAESGLPHIEDVFVRLTPDTKVEGRYRVSGGLHGVGVFVVSALSEWIQVESWNDGSHLEIEFRRGRPNKPLTLSPSARSSGTCIRLKPDNQIFPDVQFQTCVIIDRLQELAGIWPGLLTTLHDESSTHPDAVYHYPGGIHEYLTAITSQADTLYAPVSFYAEEDDIIVDGAFQFHASGSHDFRVYCNAFRITRGVPYGYFKEAVSKAVLTMARQHGLSPLEPGRFSALKSGTPAVSCVMSIRMWNPLYTSATHARLDSEETHGPVFRAVYSSLCDALKVNPELTKALYRSSLDSW